MFYGEILLNQLEGLVNDPYVRATLKVIMLFQKITSIILLLVLSMKFIKCILDFYYSQKIQTCSGHENHFQL